MVRDQIAAMIEAARDNAAEIERAARSAANDTRVTGAETASAMVERINGVERELTFLLRHVAQEADGLRAQLDRAKLGSAFRPPSGRGAIRGEAVAPDRVLSGTTTAPELSPVPAEAQAERPGAELETDEKPSETEEEPMSARPMEGASSDDDESLQIRKEPSEDGEEAPEGGLEAEPPYAAGEPPEAAEEPLEVGSEAAGEPPEAVEEPLEAGGELPEAEAEPPHAAEEQEPPEAVEELPEAEAEPPEAAEEPPEAAEEPAAAGGEPPDAVEQWPEDREPLEDALEAEGEPPHAAEPSPEDGETDTTPADLIADDRAGTTARLTEAESSVSDRTDLDLAALHNRASAMVAAADNDEEAEYWRGVVWTCVAEAASRPAFGVSGPDERAGGRRGKKRRTRVLNPLREARDEALEMSQHGSETEPLPEDGVDREPEDVPEGAADRPDAGLTAPDDSAERNVAEAESGSERGSRSRRLGRRGKKGPFVTTPGHCAICNKTFMAGSEHKLRLSGWKVSGGVGLCPEDQANGWQLPEGAMLPFRRGGARGSS